MASEGVLEDVAWPLERAGDPKSGLLQRRGDRRAPRHEASDTSPPDEQARRHEDNARRPRRDERDRN